MNRILEAFATENLDINPTCYVGGPEYRKAIREAAETAELLQARLNDEERELFDKLVSAESTERFYYEAERFTRGYRLGALMMLEVLCGSADLLVEQRDHKPTGKDS